jgi:hypothetical protein
MGLLQSRGLPATPPAAVLPAPGAGSAAGSTDPGTASQDGAASSVRGARSPAGVPVVPIALGIAAVTAMVMLVQRRRRTVAA